MEKFESTPLEQNQIQIPSAESAHTAIEEHFALVSEDGICELTTTSFPVSYENAVWPVAPEGFTGLLPTDKFR